MNSFEFRYGKLPYRSLEFKHETHHQLSISEHPLNYPNEQLYTRITEFNTSQVRSMPKPV